MPQKPRSRLFSRPAAPYRLALGLATVEASAVRRMPTVARRFRSIYMCNNDVRDEIGNSASGVLRHIGLTYGKYASSIRLDIGA
jgi:RecA/RadA recombinase